LIKITIIMQINYNAPSFFSDIGAVCSERDVVRRVSRRHALDVGRRSWSIAVAGDEGDEVCACGYVGREAKAMR
jgi:hypothetical protein